MTADELPTAEREAAEAVELDEDARKAAAAAHPVARYFAGATRYQLDAPDQGPHGPACASDDLRPGVEPTTVTLRRVPLRKRAAIELMRDPVAGWWAWVKAGVASIAGGGVEWAAKSPDDGLPDEWIEALAEAHNGSGYASENLIYLAGACKRFSDPLTSAEGKR